ncbi:TetR/AcrR family transcriptional regulator [Patulibacter defluvii]|uniref:TetR/AcrR family transcriptional regulator n=1 Tax=Patulibacter defluvii TaxID=3095358 RepID=UPI002A74BC57|nr:hypothetical protein [Patulibacter sp. DM4]
MVPETPQRRRDPERRRQQIVDAAADLLLDPERPRLTHRAVAQRAAVPLGSTTQYFATLDDLRAAALQQVAARLERELDELERALRGQSSPAAIAAVLHDYLSDGARVRADQALYLAAADDPELRPLALGWFDGLIERARRYVSPAAALAVAVFVDGAAVHASLHDEPLDLAFLTTSLAALTAIEARP